MRYFVECVAEQSYAVYRVQGYLFWKRKTLLCHRGELATAFNEAERDASRFKDSEIGRVWWLDKHGQFPY